MENGEWVCSGRKCKDCPHVLEFKDHDYEEMENNDWVCSGL